MRNRTLIAAALAFTASVAIAQTMYKPGAENVSYPKDYQTKFVQYTSVDKADRKIVRKLFINPEANAQAKKGEPLPYGTVLVMEDHPAKLAADGTPEKDAQGRFIAMPEIAAVLVQEKQKGWGVGYPDALRNGEWEYARFKGDGTRNPDSVQACFECHTKMRAGQDFVFSYWDHLQAKK